MNRRKIKKLAKRSTDTRLIHQVLYGLKMIKVWEKSKSPYSKRNMKIITKNFWRYGQLY